MTNPLRIWGEARLDRARAKCYCGVAYREHDAFIFNCTWLGKHIPWWMHFLFPLRALGRYEATR